MADDDPGRRVPNPNQRSSKRRLNETNYANTTEPATKRARQDHNTDRFKVACPFYKLDPSKYRQCRDKKIRNTSDVREHLKRCHSQPWFCTWCKYTFKKEEERNVHMRSRTCAEIKLPDPDGLTQEDLSKLVKRGEAPCPDGATEEEKRWYFIWEICCPGLERPSSIYRHPSTEFSDKLAVYWKYFKDEHLNSLDLCDVHKIFEVFKTFCYHRETVPASDIQPGSIDSSSVPQQPQLPRQQHALGTAQATYGAETSLPLPVQHQQATTPLEPSLGLILPNVPPPTSGFVQASPIPRQVPLLTQAYNNMTSPSRIFQEDYLIVSTAPISPSPPAHDNAIDPALLTVDEKSNHDFGYWDHSAHNSFIS